MDYSDYEISEDGPVYTFDDGAESVTVPSIFPRDDMDGEKIEATDGDRFTRFNLDIADQLMYMNTQQTATFVDAVDDPALLRSIVVSLKNLHHQLNFELQEERLMNANTEEQKEAIREDQQPLGHEDLPVLAVGEAVKQLSEHQVSLVDYDYAQANEDSGADDQVAEYEGCEFDSLTDIMFELQQQDFPKGVPHNLLLRLAEDHLEMDADEVESALDDGLDVGQIHENFPHHYQAYWP
jgi:hypothetical protein